MSEKVMTALEYPIPLRRADGSIRYIAKVRCPVELTTADVEYMCRYLKTLTTEAPKVETPPAGN